ncbi:hypothetical protein ANCDUO_02044 [Ancylostoma duodenale]|uniref:Uncharacterized protein n=1 Tax=Ancylostoma duodenale TaxID=51022 RepID=A0A0C2DCN1_9BILA|nr:hypothetical protein ANCDUO_02044 [Ancylostoma duodenale]
MGNISTGIGSAHICNYRDFLICDDIKKVLEQFFKDQSPALWSTGVYDLAKRSQKTIDGNGGCFK